MEKEEEKMLISIGSRSDAKITAVTRVFSRYPELWKKEEKIEYVIPSEEERGDKKGKEKDSLSGVSCIPNGMEEIIEGAKNRAKNAFDSAKVNYRHLHLWGAELNQECIEIRWQKRSI